MASGLFVEKCIVRAARAGRMVVKSLSYITGRISFSRIPVLSSSHMDCYLNYSILCLGRILVARVHQADDGHCPRSITVQRIKKVSISEQVFVNHVPAFLKDLKGVEGLFDYAEYRPNRVTFNCWNKLNGARRKRQELEQEKVHSSAFPQLPVAAPL